MTTTTLRNDAAPKALVLHAFPHGCTHAKGNIEMNLMQEDLARAHMDARLSQAREARRGSQLMRAKRLNRRADKASQRARLLLARSV
jgi:hypothetical protein